MSDLGRYSDLYFYREAGKEAPLATPDSKPGSGDFKPVEDDTGEPAENDLGAPVEDSAPAEMDISLSDLGEPVEDSAPAKTDTFSGDFAPVEGDVQRPSPAAAFSRPPRGPA
jgi:hypothetical protein